MRVVVVSSKKETWFTRCVVMFRLLDSFCFCLLDAFVLESEEKRIYPSKKDNEEMTVDKNKRDF